MKRTQNQGQNRDRDNLSQDLSVINYQDGRTEHLRTIWRASRAWDDVVDMSISGPEIEQLDLSAIRKTAILEEV